MSLDFKILDLGDISYQDAWKIQQEFFEKRQIGEVPDTLIFAQHPPTITLGSNKEWNTVKVPESEIRKRGIELYNAKRGGGAAYLGPGQIVGYTIMDIHPYGGVLNFMKMLEEVMIKTSKNFGIDVDRYDVMNPTTDKPYRATWYRNNGNDHVLCTKGIGMRLKGNGSYTHHGFCLNVNKNQSYFDLIDPCGFPVEEVKPISMEEINGEVINYLDVKNKIVENFKEVFGKNGEA